LLFCLSREIIAKTWKAVILYTIKIVLIEIIAAGMEIIAAGNEIIAAGMEIIAAGIVSCQNRVIFVC